jgi:D-alanine-D-alanine ligase
MNEIQLPSASRFKNLRIGIITGGWSAEREVCLTGGQALYNLLAEKGHCVFVIQLDSVTDLASKLYSVELDLVLLSVTEDVPVQSFLEAKGIPYIGSGVLATSLSLDKGLVKRIVAYEGIPTPPFRNVSDFVDESTYLTEHPLPLIVKPCRCGCSRGMTVVYNRSDVKAAIVEAMSYDTTVLIEQFVSGYDATSVMLDREVLAIIQIQHDSTFYNYDTKSRGKPHYQTPPQFPVEVINALRNMSLKIGNVLDCRGLYRIDWIIRSEDLKPFFLEVNTLPYLPSGEIPATANYLGIDTYELILVLFERALLFRPKRPLH